MVHFHRPSYWFSIGGEGPWPGNWIGISIDPTARNDKMHINADVKQKALLNGARYTALPSIPPLLAYKTDNWKLEIKSGIVAANLEWTTSERGKFVAVVHNDYERVPI